MDGSDLLKQERPDTKRAGVVLAVATVVCLYSLLSVTLLFLLPTFFALKSGVSYERWGDVRTPTRQSEEGESDEKRFFSRCFFLLS